MGYCIKFLGLYLVTVLLFFQIAFNQDIKDFPLKAKYENTIEYKWDNKEVLKSKDLDNMGNMNNWQHKGFGTLTFSNQEKDSGESSLKLTSSTKGEKPGPTKGRPFGAARALFKVDGQDWSKWNRISFQVYPDLPGFRTVSLSLIFHNNGEEKVPGPYDRNGFNYVLLENQEWNQVNWEIEHLGRDQVTAIELRYRLQGNEPGATDTVKYYFDELKLEKVKSDHYEGWDVASGQIAFSHIGYAQDFPKRAIASNIEANKFSVIDAQTQETVLQKPIQSQETHLGKFKILDFSEINKPGEYFIKAGGVATRNFEINTFEKLYNSTIIKTINHFYCQRCGTKIPGIHSIDHRDCTCHHGDSMVVVNGGWYDAGDLSQRLVNTAEAAYSMLALADKIKADKPKISDQLIEEAEWGVDWLLNTRFRNGYRCTWITMDYWTDGIIGNVDDLTSRANNDPYDNFVAAKTEARAYRSLLDNDSIKANYCLQVARDDWKFARQKSEELNIGLAGYGLTSSLELYKITAKQKYKQAALEYGNYILQCQQQEKLRSNVKIKGFFYRDANKKNILHYSHRGHEQEPVIGLKQLCKMFPDHDQFEKWQNAIQLYANYYKNIADYTKPYHMLPAGIYDINNADDQVEKQQIQNGVKLTDRFYIKNFPVWKTFRGNCGTVLSQTKGLASIARYLDDEELLQLCYQQLQWVMGLNPFNQSLMYGEGYNFAQQYSAMSGNIVGGLPVGVQTHFNRDEPYWPTECCYNWKEIWVHPSSRWLWIMTNFY